MEEYNNTEIINLDPGGRDEKNRSTELIAGICKEEYIRHINTYDNIYNKVNILLAVCMAIFIAHAETFKGNYIVNLIIQTNSKGRVIYLMVQLFLSVMALILLLLAMVILCSLLESQKIPVIDCFDLRNQKIYEGDIDKVTTYLIGIYTDIMKEITPIIESKQGKYDLSVKLVVISVVMFVLEEIM